MSDLSLPLGEKFVKCTMSPAAQRVLAQRAAPLVVEMELYFSCLIRKRVRFPESAHADARCMKVSEQLIVCFRPVMTRACAVSDVEGTPELTAFPIAHPEAFIPKWLTLDYRHDAWTGDFGY